MKTLIQNYSSVLSTEPMYLQRCLSECGEESILWNDPNQSAFDTFDHVAPDVFITHYKFLTNDIIKYLSGSKIKMVLNMTGAPKEDFETIESTIEQSKVDVPFVFTNLYRANKSVSPKKLRLEGLYPAADIFIPRLETPKFELDTCVISIGKNELVDKAINNEDNYHLVSLNTSDESKYADMLLDVTSLVSFYEKYDKVVLADDVNVVTSQLLFDCLLRCNSIKIKVQKEQQEILDSILAEVFVEGKEQGSISDILKSQVKTKHNCFKRAARLTRLLKNSDLSLKLERISDSL